jgi:hypothetical protein
MFPTPAITLQTGMALARLEQKQLSELPHVSQVDLRPPVVEREPQMGVGVGLEAPLIFGRQGLPGRDGQQAHAGGGAAEELPRHSEVDHQPTPVVELRDQVLAVTREPLDLAAAEAAPQAVRSGEEHVAVRGGADGGDAAGDQEGLDAAARHLDFGELGHAGGVACGASGSTTRAAHRRNRVDFPPSGLARAGSGVGTIGR